ncbi:hypothetical protein [Variovorax sp. Root473]|jgi:hypothetical protein|uniref:hypothetical protein n=1 Tax=Variovorax sp. Root473 TaxID=1736541 RepID=UPI0006F9A639|nr:hypothetical protein [Variovorax sp. Root473]KQX86884.1 hypothetical protein ASD34_11120 [Variovorax sp. Root473]
MRDKAPPLFTEACLASSFALTERREALTRLNTLLHPALQRIVAAEVAAGNRVVDVGIDWPDAGSVHVTLHRHFTGRHAGKEAAFSLCDDPHYWHADYSTADKPRHLLIC